MTDEPDQIALRSEEVRDILGTPPRWLERRGILVVTLVIMALLGLSWVFRYPDIITARITVLSENPPVTLVSKASGKLDRLFVADQQVVEEGQLLGIIENPARHEDIYSLISRIDTMEDCLGKPEVLRNIDFKGDYQLGEVHPYYTAFLSRFDEYRTSLTFNRYEEKIKSLQRQTSDLEKYLFQLTSQARILDDKMAIGKRQLSRDSMLYRQKAISEIELEKSTSEFLNLEFEHRSAIANLAGTRMQISQVQRQIAEEQTQCSEQHNLLLSSTRESYQNLSNQLRVWEQRFALKTPVRGKVTFNNIWKVNQQIDLGTEVFSVVPTEGQKIIGRVVLPVAGSGKVQPGQRVNIRLDNFPHLEYGILEGVITSMSLVPVTTAEGGFYTAEVSLDQGLVTNYKKKLPFSEEMHGEAGIITSDRRLLSRLVAPLVSLVHERMLTN